MAVGKVKIGDINLTFVFRHMWDNKDQTKFYSMFDKYSIGLWFKCSKIVGKKNANNPKEWSKNLVNDYMIGINLIFAKAWVEFNKGGLSINDK